MQTIRQNIEGTLANRLTAVEDAMKRTLDSRIGNLNMAVGKTMDQKLKESSIDAQGWKLPFLIIVVLLVAAGIGLYLFYNHLRKTHLL